MVFAAMVVVLVLSWNLCGCAQAAQGLDEGQFVNIAISGVVVLVMLVVVSILVLSSNFRCDWRSRTVLNILVTKSAVLSSTFGHRDPKSVILSSTFGHRGPKSVILS